MSNLEQRVKAYTDAHKDEHYTPAEVAAALGEPEENVHEELYIAALRFHGVGRRELRRIRRLITQRRKRRDQGRLTPCIEFDYDAGYRFERTCDHGRH